jgi:hypothetical protein
MGPAATTTRRQPADQIGSPQPPLGPPPGARGRRPTRSRRRSIRGAVRGVFVGPNEAGAPLVVFGASPRTQPVPACATVAWEGEEMGREVILVFEGGDVGKPILVGFVQPPCRPPSDPDLVRASVQGRTVEDQVDGRRLVLTADQEIVLQCGKASITLTRAGKILIRGEYLLSRSSGVNSIKGGVVQIN